MSFPPAIRKPLFAYHKAVICIMKLLQSSYSSPARNVLRERQTVHSPHQTRPQGSLQPEERAPGNEVESSLAAIVQLVSN